MSTDFLRVPHGILATGISVLAVAPAAADERFWNAPDGGPFQDASLWDDGSTGVPGVDDTAVFDLAASYDVDFAEGAITDRVVIQRGLVTFSFLPPGLTYELLGPSPALPAIVIGAETGDAASLSLVFGGLSASYANIADAPGTTGRLTLSGPITLLDLDGDLSVGARGTGFFDNLAGTALGHRGFIGRNAGAFGWATVEGPISWWLLSGSLVVGAHGTGLLDVGDFGLVETGDGIIGQDANAFGDVVVGGLLAHWSLAGSLDVGLNGYGSLRVEAGGVVAADSFCTIGTFPSPFGVPDDGGVGMVEVVDRDTLFFVGGDLHVGFLNEGQLRLGRRGRAIVGGDLLINRWTPVDPVTIEVAAADDYTSSPAIDVGGIINSETGLPRIRLELASGFTPTEGDAFDLVAAAGGLNAIEVFTPELPFPLVWVISLANDVLRANVAVCPGQDCDGNGVGDACEIEFGVSLDCNGNGVPDQCDIADGSSADCNLNGVPDECDIAAGVAADCNDNGVPDVCEVQSLVTVTSGPLGPIGDGAPQIFSLIDAPSAVTDVLLSFTAVADVGSAFEFVTVMLDGVVIGEVFVKVGVDCVATTDTIVVAMADFNTSVADGLVEIDMVASSAVGLLFCGGNSTIEVVVEYAQASENDDNGNGVPDDCECAADLDGDGDVGFSDLLIVLSSWGPCDACVADLDGDDIVDFGDLLLVLTGWGCG